MTEPRGIPAPPPDSRPGDERAPFPGAGPGGFTDDFTYVIDWDDSTPFPGMRVVCAPPTIGEYIGLLTDPEAGILKPDDDGVYATKEQRLFVESVQSWNIKGRKGTAVPVTIAGFMSLSRPLSGALVKRWIRETVEVPDPLDGPSPSGEITELEKLQTDSSSLG